MPNITKRLLRWAVVIVLLLLVPLALTIRDGAVEGVGWNWTLGDFIFAFVVLFGASLAYEFVASRSGNTLYRVAAGVAVATALILVWVNAAVGIIGDGDLDSPNGMYFGVLAIGIIGAFITGLRPAGMARTLFSMACAQMLVPVIALSIGTSDFSPGVIQVFGLNALFAAAFVTSAFLFQRSAAEATLA